MSPVALFSVLCLWNCGGERKHMVAACNGPQLPSAPLPIHAGIPVKQQVLCFAGNHLKDHLTLAEHNLDAYTLSDEVVLYLNKRLADPKQVFLSRRDKLSQPSAELVEADMPVGGVMALLESRGFAAPFGTAAHIYGKRQDGSCLPLTINPEEPLQALEERIASSEVSDATPSSM